MSAYSRNAHDRRKMRRRLGAEQNWRCAHCGRVLELNEVTIDHVFPQSMGGAHAWGNLVASCAPCNQSRAEMWARLSGHDRAKELRKLFALVTGIGQVHASLLDDARRSQIA